MWQQVFLFSCLNIWYHVWYRNLNGNVFAAQVTRPAKMTSVVVHAKEVLQYLLDTLGDSKIWAGHSYTDFDMVIRLDYLASLHIDALGLVGVRAILLHVRLPSSDTYGDQYKPMVKVRADYGKTEPGLQLETQPPHDKIVHQISKLCEAFFADQWPCLSAFDSLTFLRRLFRHVQAKILQLGEFCVVCGRHQEHAALKPVPCNSIACNFAFNEHGIGADFRDIYSRPVIADLLISMASAACQCTARRDSLFQFVPSDMVITYYKLGDPNSASQQINWQRVQNALLSCPPVATMAKTACLQDLFPDTALQPGVTKVRLLRSVLNSCRGHLIQLEGADMFPTMKTEYQFRLCTDSPSKEAMFAQLKEKRGSQFLFHGSPFYNWHCIIREGLKNMSGSSMMSHGSSSGAGIYLAEHSRIAACYCDRRGTPAWPKSIFGVTPQCIALCEVINDSFNDKTKSIKITNLISFDSGIRVVPDAKNVIIRYLFVYCDVAIPNVRAQMLSEMCEYHARRQAEVSHTARNAFRFGSIWSHQRIHLQCLQQQLYCVSSVREPEQRQKQATRATDWVVFVVVKDYCASFDSFEPDCLDLHSCCPCLVHGFARWTMDDLFISECFTENCCVESGRTEEQSVRTVYSLVLLGLLGLTPVMKTSSTRRQQDNQCVAL